MEFLAEPEAVVVRLTVVIGEVWWEWKRCVPRGRDGRGVDLSPLYLSGLSETTISKGLGSFCFVLPAQKLWVNYIAGLSRSSNTTL